VIGDDERFVSSIDDVVGEPTTAAALIVVVDRASGSNALPATWTLTGLGSTLPPVPVKVNAYVPLRRVSPAPSTGRNVTVSVHEPPPGTLRVGQLSASIEKSVIAGTL
jgi:hypothetical protein